MSEATTVTSQAFSEFLDGLSIRHIWIDNCMATVREPSLRSGEFRGLGLALAYDTHLIDSNDSGFEAAAFYGVRVLPDSGADSEESWLAQMEVEFRVCYECKHKMTEALFAQFQAVTLRLNTVPFAREWMHSTSLKMGIPPVLIPLAVSKPQIVEPKPSGAPKPTKQRVRKESS